MTHRRSPGSRQTWFAGRWPGAHAAAVLICLAIHCAPGHAELDWGAALTAREIYNDNIFDVPRDFVFQGGTVLPRRDDRYGAYGLELQASELYGAQKFYATAVAEEYRFNYFTNLDHFEYTLDGGWIWQLGPRLEGKLEVDRKRKQAAFSEVLQDQLALQTEQRESAEISYLLRARWRLEGGAYHTNIQEPLQGEPDLKLSESSEKVALQYLGVSDLVAGADVTYITGKYSGTVNNQNPAYRQTSGELLATYEVTKRSSFSGQAGYSRRTSADSLNATSGFTGKLTYNNQLTGKTSLSASFERGISSYISNSGAQLSTSVSGGAIWQVTHRTGVSASYTWSSLYLPDQGGASRVSRTDHLQFASVKAALRPLDWLRVEPYVNLQRRRSNLNGINFNSNEYGVNFTLQWRCVTPVTPGIGLLPCI